MSAYGQNHGPETAEPASFGVQGQRPGRGSPEGRRPAPLARVRGAQPRGEWADLFTHAAPPDDAPRVCAPLDPVDCALRDPADLADALRAMTPAQRMAQAVAQAAWLQGFGYPVTVDEMLRDWEYLSRRAAA